MLKRRISKFASNPGIPNLPDNILLGRAVDSDVEWTPSQAGHILVSGEPGSGKTVFLHNIAEQCRLKNWLVLAINSNPENTDIWLPGRNIDTVTDIVSAIHMLDEVMSIMTSRLQLMENEVVNNFKELENPPLAILVVIDDIDKLLETVEIDSYVQPPTLYTDQFRRLLFSIMRISRAAGIHFVISHTNSLRIRVNPLSPIPQTLNSSSLDVTNFSVQVITSTNSMHKDDVLFGQELPSLSKTLGKGWISYSNQSSAEVQLYGPVF